MQRKQHAHSLTHIRAHTTKPKRVALNHLSCAHRLTLTLRLSELFFPPPSPNNNPCELISLSLCVCVRVRTCVSWLQNQDLREGRLPAR